VRLLCLRSLLLLLFAASSCLAQPRVRTALPAGRVTGAVERFEQFPSRFVGARNIDVWLPPGYAKERSRRYAVVYMHDGQNLFDPGTSHIGVDWGVDEAMTKLIAAGAIEPAIIVGIWSTPKRVAEYMAAKAVPDSAGRDSLLADRYLEFIVRELRPVIDSAYRTARRPESTFIMGSSRGGLVSAYAICEYPEIFGGAGCVSTHWVAWEGAALSYLRTHLPDPASHRFYFDYGTRTLDSLYEPYQLRADAILAGAGYTPGRNWVTRKFEGAEHSERSWRTRVDTPLTFFLQKKAAARRNRRLPGR
jgi:predicted alpha/beta superfamily hydrolase